MKEAIFEGIMIGSIAVLVMVALAVWGIVLAEVLGDYPLIQMSLIVLLTIAIPVTLNVVQYKKKNPIK